MANQKQRRRRAKEKRHEYDLVFVDEDGVERAVEREEEPRKPPSRVAKSGTSRGQKSSAGKSSRTGRVVQPPSWPKVLKRGAILAPVFLVIVMLLGGSKMTIQQGVFQTVLLVAVFVPFSYFMDRVLWRQQEKRQARGA